MAKLAHVDIESGKIDIQKLQSDLNSMIGYIQTVKGFEVNIQSESSGNRTDTEAEYEPLHEDISQMPRDPSELLQQAPRVTTSNYFHMPPRGTTGVEI